MVMYRDCLQFVYIIKQDNLALLLLITLAPLERFKTHQQMYPHKASRKPKRYLQFPQVPSSGQNFIRSSQMNDSQQVIVSNRSSDAPPMIPAMKLQKSEMQDQLQQIDEIQQSQSIEQSGSRTDEKTSFVSNMTQRKRIQKKKKINDYLQQHRNNLPTERRNQLNSQYVQDEFDDQLHQNSQQKGKLQQQLQKIKNGEIKNRIFQQFIISFNKDPEKAIQKQIKKKLIKDDTPKSIANYLFKVQGLSKSALGQYFGKNNERNMDILRSYCTFLNFRNLQFDLALRKLLSRFKLPGEAQQIERIVWEFALSFHQQNQDLNDNADQLFPLAYAIIMLATDAHNPKQQKKMSCPEFIKNTQRACPSIVKDDLQMIYSRIVKHKLQTQNTVYDKMPDMYLKNIKQALQYRSQLKKGMMVSKIIQNNRTYFGLKKTNKNCEFLKRKIYLSQDQEKICWVNSQESQQQPRFILINDITDLTIGIGQHLQTKKNIPKQCQIQFFTITTKQRTLDIRTQTTMVRSIWLNYLRAIMIQKRTKRIEILQNQYSQVLKRQNIQNAWTSEIFPNWDRYWDYQTKKPKYKGYIQQTVQKFCYCFSKRNQNKDNVSNQPNTLQLYNANNLGLPETYNILQIVWKYGLSQNNRKTLWQQIIGNPLQLNTLIVEDIKKRLTHSEKLRSIQQNKNVIQTAQFLLTLRPDLPHVNNLIETSRIFNKVFTNQRVRLISISNLIYKQHFLPFYKGDLLQIELRTKLFDDLLEKNVPFVKMHFDAIKLQTKFYLINWFLSVFYEIFLDNFLLRIWDNFILEGEIYLFKVGIALIKYYEIELKMCTFYEGLKILKFPSSQTQPVLFFQILQKQISVKSQDYFEYITRRKHALIKTRIQSIPLQE